jgi:hypothetical protein
MAVLKNNTGVNLDVVISSGTTGGASLGAGLTTERRFAWSGNADITLSQIGTVNATYNLPNLTAGPSPSTTLDTLIGYSNYSIAGSGSLLFGGPLGSPNTTNVAPIALSAGAAGTALQVLSSSPTTLGWLPLASTTWSQATATQTGVAGNGYYVLTGACTFTIPTGVAAGQYLALYSAASGAAWSIALSSGQTIQFGNVLVSNSLSSNPAETGDGIWLLSTGSNNWVVLTAVGNIVYS